MAFSWNRFAYTNFHELNLDWFSEHFKEIFEEWEELYNTLTQWKDDTDADLAQWKTDTLQEMEQWENDLLDALNQWKSDTGEDIDEWESGVIADLNDWKANFLEAYEALEERVEAIVSNTENMVDNLAEPFSTSSVYNEGDYVIYNGKLYKFITNHSAGAWNANEVIESVAMKNVEDNFKIDGINTIKLDWQSGGLYGASGIEYSDSSRRRTPFIECNYNDIIAISKYSGVASVGCFEFASNTTTSSGNNERLVFYSVTTNFEFYRIGHPNTKYVRFMVVSDTDTANDNVFIYKLNNPLFKAFNSPLFVTPSMFKSEYCNTDMKMVQSAINYAIKYKCDVAFDRLYTLNSGEYLTLNKYNTSSQTPEMRYITRFFGLGGNKITPENNEVLSCGIVKNGSDHIFTANDSYKYSGDFIFENLTFIGTNGNGCNVFNMNTLMRLTVKGCYFKNIDSVAKNTYITADIRTHYWQDVKFEDCTIVGGTGWAFYATGVYCVELNGLTIEQRDGGIRMGVYYSTDYYSKCRNLKIADCCIESISGIYVKTLSGNTPANAWAIHIECPMQVSIENCYFEQNYKNILLRNGGSDAVYNTSIKNCWLGGRFIKKRYGDNDAYSDIVDDKYLVTIGGTTGTYQIENCASQFGAIINAPANTDTMKILYLANGNDASAKGESDYTTFTYDSDLGYWIGSGLTENNVVVTGANNNQNKCKTYSVVNMT